MPPRSIIQYVRPTSDAEVAAAQHYELARSVRADTTVVRLDRHGVAGGGKQIVKLTPRPVGRALTIVGAGEAFSVQFAGTINTRTTSSSGQRMNVPKTLTVMGSGAGNVPIAEVFAPSVLRIVPTSSGTVVASLQDAQGADLALGNLMPDLVTAAGAEGTVGMVNTDEVDTAVVSAQYTIGVSFQTVLANRAAFDAAFKADLGALLGVEATMIVIQAIAPGSCKVDFSVLLGAEHALVTATLAQAAADLQTTLQTPPADVTAAFATVVADVLAGDATAFDAAATALSSAPTVQIVPAAHPMDEEAAEQWQE